MDITAHPLKPTAEEIAAADALLAALVGTTRNGCTFFRYPDGGLGWTLKNPIRLWANPTSEEERRASSICIGATMARRISHDRYVEGEILGLKLAHAEAGTFMSPLDEACARMSLAWKEPAGHD